MNTYRIGNISIEDFRHFLADKGCQKVDSGNTGHEKWAKAGILRPVVFQTRIDPIPEFIIRNNLRNLGLTSNDFRAWLRKRDMKKRSD